MSLHHGDCLDVMAGMEPESVDAVVTDPPYGLEFMGKEWDKLFRTYDRGSGRPDSPTIKARDGAKWAPGSTFGGRAKQPRCMRCGKLMGRGTGVCRCPEPIRNERREEAGYQMQYWHGRWAEAAYRVAKPSAYLLAFGGTRTVHRMTVAIEDAGWVIRDMLVWAYASGFPKSKASLKPAWEPIVMARKPGPLRMLAIDVCRIEGQPHAGGAHAVSIFGGAGNYEPGPNAEGNSAGRWPANVILTDPIFDGGWEGVVGGRETTTHSTGRNAPSDYPDKGVIGWRTSTTEPYDGDSGTYSRFFIIPKADRADREPVLGGLPEREAYTHNSDGRDMTKPTNGHGAGERARIERGEPAYRPRANVHPTVKPVDLMRHLVRLVTPTGGTVLDPFLGSGTTAIAAEMEGFDWIGIEKEREYCDIAEARLNGTQRGLGLPA